MTGEQFLKALQPIKDVQRVALRPDDVLVIECDQDLSQADAERLKDALADVWPEHKVVIFTTGMRLKGIGTGGR